MDNMTLIIFLLTVVILAVSVAFNLWFLNYGSPFKSFVNIFHDLPRVNLQNTNIQLIFNSDLKNIWAKWFFFGVVLLAVPTIFLMLAMIYPESLPLVVYVNNSLPGSTMYDSVWFLGTPNLTHITLAVLLIWGLIIKITLPVMPRLPRYRVHPRNEIIYWKRFSHRLASVRLSRYDTLEKTFIYVNYRNRLLGTLFRLVFCQGKERGARTECYVYSDEDHYMLQMIPSPISVQDVNKIFGIDDE